MLPTRRTTPEDIAETPQAMTYYANILSQCNNSKYFPTNAVFRLSLALAMNVLLTTLSYYIMNLGQYILSISFYLAVLIPLVLWKLFFRIRNYKLFNAIETGTDVDIYITGEHVYFSNPNPNEMIEYLILRGEPKATTVHYIFLLIIAFAPYVGVLAIPPLSMYYKVSGSEYLVHFGGYIEYSCTRGWDLDTQGLETYVFRHHYYQEHSE
jgi:hypothetical protein